LLVGVCSIASAAQTNYVANTSQKGSLLVFPKIVTTNDSTGTWDTIITISNDLARGTNIKCYWVNSKQEIQDFQIIMTINQPMVFRASDGTGSTTIPPFFRNDVGELKCWAVDFPGQIAQAWNHLYGTATVVNYTYGTAFEYNAFAFTARNLVTPLTGSIPAMGPPPPLPGSGNLKLAGLPSDPTNVNKRYYDACPSYLTFNFFAQDTSEVQSLTLDRKGTVRYGKTDLTLVPCLEDLRQERTPTCTKAKFDIWNENETKYTGAYQCIKCWFEGFLNQIGTVDSPYGKDSGFGGEKFTLQSLHTPLGRARVTPQKSTVCDNVFVDGGKDLCTGGQVVSPLLGLVVTQVEFANGIRKMFGQTVFTAGQFKYEQDPVTYIGNDNIYWDPSGPTYEGPGK
jgi:hypothetical protein